MILFGTITSAQTPNSSFSAQASKAKLVRVAIVSDGPTDRDVFPAALIEREIANVTDGDIRIVFPADRRFAGDWTARSVDAAIDRALTDSQVDMVLAVGVLASHQIAHRERLAKPVIAPVVIDPILQTYPLNAGKSNRKNFTYIADFQGLGDDVRTFKRIVGFKKLAAVVDEALIAAIPELRIKAEQLAKELQTEIVIVPTTTDVSAALAAIPQDVDAVYVAGLLRFTQTNMRELADGLIRRKLPSFSVIGRPEIEGGLLLTTGGAERDVERMARRVVLMIQRTAEGEDPATFDVAFPTEQKLIVNMRTAQSIGFSPRWQDLADAEQLNAQQEVAPPLSMVAAMKAALASNPALAASRARLDSTADDVRIARSSLAPSLNATATGTQIDQDRASPLSQAEQSASAGVSSTIPLYSERAWANYSISKSILEATKQGERQDALNTLQDAASAYLDVLRAKSLEAVRRSNVENTRKNLETARVRESVGLGGRSDLLRWQAELARDKQDLLSAEASRRLAETELARIIHRPASQPFETLASGLEDPLTLVSGPRARAFMETPAKWSVFTEYAVNSALSQAPETAQVDALIAGRQRAVTAARRAFYLPELALVSNRSKTFYEEGAGSSTAPGAPDNDSWSVSVQVSFPVFTSGLRDAQLSQARNELRASEADRLTATDGVEARTRAYLHRAASSYPSIELSAEAAAAANENLSMVTDAYARGAVSVTDLIDAQNTALNAGLAAADAKYAFLSDFVGVLRAMNEFDILLDAFSREAWFERVDDWFRTHSTAGATRL